MKTSELTAPALDWAVAKCEGVTSIQFTHAEALDACDGKGHAYQYSRNWLAGGPIIEREFISINAEWDGYNPYWVATIKSIDAIGPTPLIAAMRCYVASKLGDKVEIPEELE